MDQTTDGNGSINVQDRPPLPPGEREAAHEAFARNEPEPPPQPPKTPFYQRPLVLIVGGIVLVAAVVIGLLWYLHSRQFESTDDAFIEADVTNVSPRVAGYVLRVLAEDNHQYGAGAVLVELDPKDLQAIRDEAAAGLQAAQASLQTAKDNAAAAQADVGSAQAAEQAAQTEQRRAGDELKRYENLPAAAVTQQQIINLRAAAQSAEAQFNAARQKTFSAQAHVKWAQSQIEVAAAQVTQAQATLERATLQLSYTKIRAPITGYVTNRSVNVGDYVQLNEALLALVPQQVYVIANYKETQLHRIRERQDVDITIDAFPGHVFHGRVDTIEHGSGAAFSLLPPENATGNYVKVVQRVPVKITFDSQGYLLGPGMSVVPKVKVQ